MTTEKIRVLFICVGNSFRSQISEAVLNHKYGDRFQAESAGFLIRDINPLAIEVMKEVGIDISNYQSNHLMDFYKEGRHYEYVITVCNKSEEEDCPIFPGVVTRLSWGDFKDPENFTGTDEEKLEQARNLRDDIIKKVEEFVHVIA